MLPALGWLLSSGTNLGVEVGRAALPGHGDLPLHLLVLAQGPLLVTLVVEQDSVVQVDERVAPTADTQRGITFPAGTLILAGITLSCARAAKLDTPHCLALTERLQPKPFGSMAEALAPDVRPSAGLCSPCQ